jgi:CheY-like chemotaxis protein
MRADLTTAHSSRRRRNLRCWLGLLAVLFGWTATLNAGDPYATALDKRFEGPAPQPPVHDPGVTALENALKEQVRQMSVRPEIAPPVVETGTQPWVILVTIMTLGSGLSLVAVLVLRRWDRWLDQEAAKRLSALTDDPLMAEFLRTLHEEQLLNPVPDQPGTTVEAMPHTTVAAAPEVISETAPRQVVEGIRKLTTLRNELKKLNRAADDAERQTILCELLVQTEAIKQEANHATLRSTRLLASALHGLLNQLSIKPANISASALHTAASAIDLLEVLTIRPVRGDLVTSPPVRLLAVDDDAISRRAVSLALKKAFSDPDLAQEGRSALSLAEKQPYDVIFLDIEMPGMDGFELCAKIRETEANRKTPIVFVTSHTDFDSRAKSALLGAHDLIGKPFLAFEITVKALTLVLRARQESEGKRPTPPTLEVAPSETPRIETEPVTNFHRGMKSEADRMRSQTADV